MGVLQGVLQNPTPADVMPPHPGDFGPHGAEQGLRLLELAGGQKGKAAHVMSAWHGRTGTEVGQVDVALGPIHDPILKTGELFQQVVILAEFEVGRAHHVHESLGIGLVLLVRPRLMGQVEVAVAQVEKAFVVVFRFLGRLGRLRSFGSRDGVLETNGYLKLILRLEAVGVRHIEGNIGTELHPFLVGQVSLPKLYGLYPVLDRVGGYEGRIEEILHALVLGKVPVEPVETPKGLPAAAPSANIL